MSEGMVKENNMKSNEISLVEALRETMEAYNVLRSKWISDHDTDNGFDAWFTEMVNAERGE